MEKRDNIEIKITKLTPEDVGAMQWLLYKTWLKTYPNEELGITIDDIEDYFRDKITPEKIEEMKRKMAEKPRGVTLIAKEEEKMVGMCYIIEEDDRNVLKAIYVLPDYQGKGIGKKLWYEAEKFLNKEKDIYLEVASYNYGAIGFYNSLGFEETGKTFLCEDYRMKSGNVIPTLEMVKKAETSIIG